MAREVKIPVTTDCALSFQVRYRLTAGGPWTNLPTQFGTLEGSPAVLYVIIRGLSDDTEYDIGINQLCCNGVYSGEFIITVLTELPS